MSRYAKALAAFFTTAAGVVASWAVYPDWRQIVIGVCTIGGAVVAVYLTPNDPPKGEPADPHMSERGPVADGPARDELGRFAPRP